MSEDVVVPRERTKTLALAEPVSFNKQDYYELNMRVPKIAEIQKAQTHLKGTPDSSIRMMMVLVSLVTGMPEPAVALVDYDVILEANEWLMGFTPTPPKTLAT